MSKPVLLDLFCGAGGAAMGYHRAGFEVVGIDINPQPHYPFEFVQADAMNLPVDISAFDVIHASPPCQGYTPMSNRWGSKAQQLVEEVRTLLRRSGALYVIENVPGAPLSHPVRICGSALGLGTFRHRLFESNLLLLGTQCQHKGRSSLPIYGKMDGRRLWTRKDKSILRACKSLAQARHAMGIDWMEWDEIREAIPPEYTFFLGQQIIRAMPLTADLSWIQPEVPRSQRRKAQWSTRDYPASLSREVMHYGVDVGNSCYEIIRNACGRKGR